MEQSQLDEKRFNKIFFFIVFFGALNILLIATMIFCHIPKENQQSANMALAFCMGTFTALAGYLIGASPDKKKDITPGTTQSSVVVTKIDPPDPNKEKPNIT